MSEIPYLQRDISWLGFNARVLQEAKDPTVPLLERIKFLAIYSNNLDEFFRVRVAHHRNIIRLGKKEQRKLKLSSDQILKRIKKIVNKQQVEFTRIFEKEIIPDLKDQQIYFLRWKELNGRQQKFVEDYFQENLLPFVQPVLLVKNRIRAFLNNAALYLGVLMFELEDEDFTTPQYALVKIPSDHIPRFISIPSEDGMNYIIMLDEIVRHNIAYLFPGYKIKDTFSIKLTRDAELYIDDEYSGNLLSKIKNSLKKRNIGPPSRFVHDREMPKKVLSFLKESFELQEADILVEGRYHNNFDFFGFPDFGKTQFQRRVLEPLKSSNFENSSSVFDLIGKKDQLLFYPYHDYDYVIRFFEEAARDIRVTHIKIVQYRVAKRSRVMKALIEAVKHGKSVTVFVEVKARFDEEANLEWAEKLERAGVNVLYSFPGLKVHCKLAFVVREEDEGTKFYSYLSTGNFHEGTAKIYTDFGLFTADPRITFEVGKVFSFLETVQTGEQSFEHLMVGQFNLRPGLESSIRKEIDFAKAGKKAEIILKVNSLEDVEMIELLYEASQAGVRVKIIARGVCSLIPGIPGFSDNITAISIVDQYLEHSRVFIFRNGGDKQVFLSSADFMTRNLSYRIETSFPLYDSDIRDDVIKYIDLQLKDNVKARKHDADLTNEYLRNDQEIVIRSQIETYYLIKRKEEMIL